MQYGFYLVMFAAALTLPWWVTVPLMVIALGFEHGAPFVVGTALLMDALYGTNIDSLYGLSFLYTLVFSLAAVVAILLKRRVMD